MTPLSRNSRCVAFVGCALAAILVIRTWIGSVPTARADGEPNVAKKMKLSDVYTTSEQKGLIALRKSYFYPSEESERMSEIDRSYSDNGRSKPIALFVRGDTVREALQATIRALKPKGSPKNFIGPTDTSKSNILWLFVYVGHSSSQPVKWAISEPEYFDNEVRIYYSNHDPWPEAVIVSDADTIPYSYLVPLGKQKDPSTWSAELFELKKTRTGTANKP